MVTRMHTTINVVFSTLLKRLHTFAWAQVKYHAAQQFSRAAMQAAAQRSGGASASDRAYQVLLYFLVFLPF